MKVTLTIIGGPNRGQFYTFDSHDTFVVGRGWSAHLRLPPKDRFFSRNHFLLEINPPLCRLVDMASANGTYVNDQRVSEADLRDGDRIRGGDTVIQVNLDPPLPAAEHASPTGTAETVTCQAVHSGHDLHKLAETIDCTPATPPGHEAPPLRQLGTFTLLRELGRGGMGIVYLARSPEGQHVALKTLKTNGPVVARDLQRFMREASILKQLRHPNTVAFHDCGECDGIVYLSMEYVPGSDAQRLLRESGRLDVPTATGIICEVLRALEFAHARGFIHRDIKPANILIGPTRDNEQIKLADFGLARVYHASCFSGLTLQGDMAGSMAFMPPEQITNYRNIEPASDLYGVSATLYTLLTGRHVYDFPDRVPQRLLMILQDDPVPLTRRRDDLPAGLADIVHQGLQRDPTQRFPSAGAMRNLLLPFAQSRPSTP